MNPHNITPLILTLNEAANLRRSLERLSWARRILIVDSGSDDETLSIAREFPQVKVMTRPFDTFANQCNFGLEHIYTEWVLSLDADYIFPDNLPDIITNLSEEYDGYRFPFRYCIKGYPLRATPYPPRIVLYRRNKARYLEDGHAHKVTINGSVIDVNVMIDHDDRKPLSRWLNAEMRYSEQEAEHLYGQASDSLNRVDRIRCWIFPFPFLMFLYCYFWKGLIFDGVPGLYYSMQRLYAEVLLSLKLLERKLSQKINSHND